MDKRGIRNLGKLLRESGDVESFGEKAYGFLSELKEYKNAETIMLYLSLKKEAPTDELAEKILADKKRVVVPVTMGREMTLSEITSDTEYKVGGFNVREPIEIKPFCDKDVDLCIVPGLLFDRKGTRCGYGKGCYDLFLSKVNPVKVGLAFEVQVIKGFPSEEHDVKMDYIITEKELINCGKDE